MKGFWDGAGFWSMDSHRERGGFVRQLPSLRCVYTLAHNRCPVIVVCYGQKEPEEETTLPLITRLACPWLSSRQTVKCSTAVHVYTPNHRSEIAPSNMAWCWISVLLWNLLKWWVNWVNSYELVSPINLILQSIFVFVQHELISSFRIFVHICLNITCICKPVQFIHYVKLFTFGKLSLFCRVCECI